MQRENKEDPRFELNGVTQNPNPEAIYTQRENKLDDRFRDAFGASFSTSDEKYLLVFIQSEIDMAVAEERETLTKELTKRAEQSEGERFQTFVEVLAIITK